MSCRSATGPFVGPVDSAAGRMGLVYKRVPLEYDMRFKRSCPMS